MILLPTVITLVWYGGWAYALLITLAGFLAASEYVQMLKAKAYGPSLLLVAAGGAVWLADAIWGLGEWLTPLVGAVLFGVTGWILARRRADPQMKDPTAQWALTLGGGLYLGIGCAFLIRLRALPDGLWWCLTAFPVVWISESMAYFVGKRWGRHKMAPTISPGKSWEGYLAEVISGTLTGALLGWVWPTVSADATSLNIWKGILVGIVVSSVTTAGDFFVSVIKREVGVKDSGKLIPGHGGIFDRIDSLLWTGWVTWLIASLVT